MKTKLLLQLLLFTGVFSMAQAQTSTLVEELGKMNNLAQLPQYIEDSEAYMISSYDPTGGNDDGFSGKYSYIRKEGENRFVMADIKGPGLIQRFWTPIPTQDRVEFYFDGEKKPRISLKFEDFFTGNHYPFVAPLCGNEIGGYYSYVPIPFAKSLKIVYVGTGLKFHQIQYRKFHKRKKVTSFSMDLSEAEKQALAKAGKPWLQPAKQLLQNASNTKKITAALSISPGQTVTLANLKAGGRIVGVQLNNAKALATKNADLLFRAQWDQDKQYGINVPLAPLLGYAFGKNAMQSLLMGTDADTNYIHLPMPFDQQAKLELHYLKREMAAQKPIQLTATIYYTDQKRNPKTEGRFYASYNREAPKTGQNFTILKQAGKGHHVGTLLFCQSTAAKEMWFPTGFFEGDEYTTVDGELRMHGTGSEDYFNGGWYGVADRWDAAFSLPIHGCLAYSIPLARTAAYRFYTSDKVNFNKSYELTIEHDGGTNTWPVDYGAIALYYGDTPPTNTVSPNAANTQAYQTPKRLEIVLNHFNIQSLAFPPQAVNLAYTKVAQKDVFKFSTQANELVVKTSLDLPVDGTYKLYMSYFESPDSEKIKFYQRQKPLSDWVSITANEPKLIENRFVGMLQFKNGRAPLTFKTQGEPGKNGFTLYKMVLEKVAE